MLVNIIVEKIKKSVLLAESFSVSSSSSSM